MDVALGEVKGCQVGSHRGRCLPGPVSWISPRVQARELRVASPAAAITAWPRIEGAPAGGLGVGLSGCVVCWGRDGTSAIRRGVTSLPGRNTTTRWFLDPWVDGTCAPMDATGHGLAVGTMCHRQEGPRLEAPTACPLERKAATLWPERVAWQPR